MTTSTISKQPKLTSLDEYRKLYQTFCLECPEYFNFGFDVVDRWAKQRPDHPAMRWVSSDGADRKITLWHQSYGRNGDVHRIDYTDAHTHFRVLDATGKHELARHFAEKVAKALRCPLHDEVEETVTQPSSLAPQTA